MSDPPGCPTASRSSRVPSRSASASWIGSPTRWSREALQVPLRMESPAHSTFHPFSIRWHSAAASTPCLENQFAASIELRSEPLRIHHRPVGSVLGIAQVHMVRRYCTVFTIAPARKRAFEHRMGGALKGPFERQALAVASTRPRSFPKGRIRGPSRPRCQGLVH